MTTVTEPTDNTGGKRPLSKPARRMVAGLALLALGFYVGFILMAAFGR